MSEAVGEDGGGNAREVIQWMGLVNEVKNKEQAGTVKPCFALDMLNPKLMEEADFDELQVAYACGDLMQAGSDTTSSSLIYLIQALITHPWVQDKAHAELDAVVCQDRMPGFEDEKNLPYIRCIVKEILRWRPTVILGVPHAVIRDDYYDVYIIPEGSTVIFNTWYSLQCSKRR